LRKILRGFFRVARIGAHSAKVDSGFCDRNTRKQKKHDAYGGRSRAAIHASAR
jgi:hypothetical protein